MAAISGAARGGPLNPPAGAVAGSNKTLQELADKIARTDQGIAEPRTPITSLPFTISASGSYYLTASLSLAAINTHAITIAADYVTLDLGGFTLTGPGSAAGSSGVGIIVSSFRQGIRVCNGVVKGFRGTGVDVSQTYHAVVDSVVSLANGARGILAGSESVLYRCTAGFNLSDGIQAASAFDCTAHNNSGNGISIAPGLCSGCTAVDNSLVGIYVSGRAEGCYALRNQDGISLSGYSAVANSSADLSSRDNFRIWGGGRTRVQNCQGSRGATGVHVLGTPTDDIVIEGNFLFQNSIGIHIEAGSALVVRNQLSNTTNISAIAGNVIGPTVDASNIATSNSPHANYAF